MGTFADSAYRRARKEYVCQASAAGHRIQRDQLYLSYKPGLHSQVRVCLACSVKKNPQTDRLLWDCQVVRARIEALGESAGVEEAR